MSGLTELEINQLEYCFLVADTHGNSSTFPVHIPKIMPLVGMSDKKVKTVINNNILVNAADCKPQTASSYMTQGYYTIGRFENVNLSHKTRIDGYITKGARFIAAVMDKNIRDMYITGNM